MAFSTAVYNNLVTPSSSSSSSHTSSQVCCLRLNRKHRVLAIPMAQNRKRPARLIIRSLLESNIGSSGNGAGEPTRVLLEKLFVQTQKLEEQMSNGSHLPEGVSINLEVLESDLKGALAALRKKEEDLQDAERMVTELNQAKRDLEQQEEEIAAVYSKQEELEEDLKKANDNLVSQARQIEDLKLLVGERDREIVAAQSALFLKEEEVNTMRDELMKKNEEAVRIYSDLNTRDQLLKEANEVIKKQQVTVEELERSVREKEHEFAASVQLRKDEEERMKVMEANLEKRTVEWLMAREVLSKLEVETSKHLTETKDNMEGLKTIRKLLIDVRSELVSAQKSLTSFRRKMEDQELLVERQLAEVNELKLVMMLYMTSLKEAQEEVESERAKLRVEQARSKELEHQLQMEQDLIGTLQEELNNEKSSLQKATQEQGLLREELERKTCEFNEAQNLLQVKESELVDARLQIQHLKSEQASVQRVLQVKDADLRNAQEKLEDVNHEVAELKMLMKNKEDNLIEATGKLWEKEEHVQTMQHELDDTKQRFLEAVTVVERISQLTNKLVTYENYGSNSLELLDDTSVLPGTENEMQQAVEKPVHDLRRVKQLEDELEMAKQNLRWRETELVAVQRDLAAKDEELKTVLDGWGMREMEMKRRIEEEMREEAEGLKKLYALAEETIRDRNVADLAIEKLQLEAAGLEVEAATSALHSLADMSQKLLNETGIALSFDDVIFQKEKVEQTGNCLRMSECFKVAQREVARLSSLTEQLVNEASIITSTTD
ncbi:uncharacterized protein LOC131255432 [Magnolia sinica]|uniref:uncharacterized protein LOC131255432 n=1 Tax=Magnolia sinica TaxID=86752 RepID=UPI00265945E8|nr:uncharacterized protein LOC131255432 [Magnolia sinica]